MCYTNITLNTIDKHRKCDRLKYLHNMTPYLKIIIASICVFCGVLAAQSAFPLERKYLKVKLQVLDEPDRPEPAEEKPKKNGFLINNAFKKIMPEKAKSKKVHVLKKADIERIGALASYDEFSGLRFGKYFSVGQRMEIFQEARPIDAYILDAKAIRYLGRDGAVLKWDTPAHFRSQIVPMFTRAYGTQVTMDNPDDPGTQIRYTLDYRDIYKQYYPKYDNLGKAEWLQDEIMLIHSGMLNGIDWWYNLNWGYRYSTINETDNANTPTKAGYENRHTYIVNIALAPTNRLEWFGQFEYFKSKRPRSSFAYSPDHWYFRTELRTKTPDFKTSIIPSFSYSTDFYFPFKNRFEKYEIGMRVGRDFTEKIRGTTQLQYVLSLRDEPDNTAPDYGSPHPVKDMAAWLGAENRLSFNFWKEFYLQGGLDIAAGTNMSDFDNWGTFLGLEYYKPGILRANLGWNTNVYYNIDDLLSTLGVNVYVLM